MKPIITINPFTTTSNSAKGEDSRIAGSYIFSSKDKPFNIYISTDTGLSEASKLIRQNREPRHSQMPKRIVTLLRLMIAKDKQIQLEFSI